MDQLYEEAACEYCGMHKFVRLVGPKEPGLEDLINLLICRKCEQDVTRAQLHQERLSSVRS
jgi:DNA-directed RNA polymerase subunit RPC12/RpoP